MSNNLGLDYFLQNNLSFKTNLDDTIFASSFFINSWVGGSKLTDDEFNSFVEKIYQKDLDQDNQAFKMPYILIHKIKLNEIYLVKIEDFLKSSIEQRQNWYNDFTDFFIPRTIWYKAFCLLQKDLPNEFKILN